MRTMSDRSSHRDRNRPRRGHRLRPITISVLAVLAFALLGAATGCTPGQPANGTVLTKNKVYVFMAFVNTSRSLYYDGTAGERLNLSRNMSNWCDCEGWDDIGGLLDTITLKAPDGSVVEIVAQRLGDWDGDREWRTNIYELPLTGRYRIVFDYVSGNTRVPLGFPFGGPNYSTTELTLSNDEPRGTVGLGELPRPAMGQTLSFTYEGTAGDRLVTSPVHLYTFEDLFVLKDPASNLVPLEADGGATLPTTGPYTIEVLG